MKNYMKPQILENSQVRSEIMCAGSGEMTDTPPQSPSAAPVCHKDWWQLPYTITDWYDCKGKCQYYQHANGWGALNDTCTIQYNHG